MEILQEVTKLVAVAAWPAIAIYVLVAFRNPLRRTLEHLPNKLEQASKVSVGSFTLEVQAKLAASGDAEIAALLPQLNRPALEALIHLRTASHAYGLVSTSHGLNGEESYALPPLQDLDALKLLFKLKLLAFTEPLEEFLAFFASLPGRPETARPNHGLQVAKASLSPSDQERVRRQQYSLTDAGRRAYDAIFSSVLEQISKKA